MTATSPPLNDVPAGGSPSAVAQPDATAASWYGLTVLIIVSLFGVLDRQVFILQAEPIRVALSLSDFQLGLLQGLGVSLFAAIVGYPIGWLADRYDRRWVLACCMALWSLAVVGCGLAQNFTSLLIGSAVVGAGEAALLPVCFALIPEMFRNSKRQLANSLNQVAGRVGTGLVIALCGYLTVFADSARPYLPQALQGLETWRLTFFAAALPAPVFFLLLVTLPVRGRAAPRARVDATGMVAAPGIELLTFLRANRAGLGGLLAGIALAVCAFAAIAVWLPVSAMRDFGATPVQVGNALGTATLVAALVGLVFSTYGLRWLRTRVGVGLPVVGLALSCGLAGLTALCMPLAHSANALFVIFGLTMTFAMLGVMTYPTALQEAAPAHLRARIFAISGVLGVAFPSLVPPLIGLISDQFSGRPGSLLWVTALSTGFFFLTSAIVLTWASRHYAAALRSAAEHA